jgi:hypothetical protein
MTVIALDYQGWFEQPVKNANCLEPHNIQFL